MAEQDSNNLLRGIVELYELTWDSLKKAAKGCGTTKTNIVVAVSKDENGKPQYVKMQIVPDLKEKTIGKFAKGCIEEGSVVQTDAYFSYRKPLAEKKLYEYQVFDAE